MINKTVKAVYIGCAGWTVIKGIKGLTGLKRLIGLTGLFAKTGTITTKKRVEEPVSKGCTGKKMKRGQSRTGQTGHRGPDRT